jgi:acetate kinase
MKILIFNAGSSSLKFSLFEAEDERLLAEGGVDWASEPTRLVVRSLDRAAMSKELRLHTHAEAVARVIGEVSEELGDLDAVAHRVVHGGAQYAQAVRITPAVRYAIEELAELAPLHNRSSLRVIDAVTQNLPHVAQVAAFDTSFHATLPESARTYAVPRAWTCAWGLRRYGFHGLSHQYCTTRAAQMLGRRDLRLIIAHLGNGASVSAVVDGRCVDTSMGFTPMEGLMMGTRSGSVDPGLLIHLLRHKGFDAEGLDRALNHESGLLGVSGVSSDMREVLAAAPRNVDARLAIDIYVHRLRRTIGAMAATLGGVDALVFTAGVGENAPEIRRRACENLGFLGVVLDERANAACRPDADAGTPASAGRVLVIATREDLTILRETRRVLALPSAATAPSEICNALPIRTRSLS